MRPGLARPGRLGAALGAIVGLVVVGLLVTEANSADLTQGRAVCAQHGQRFSGLIGKLHVVRATSVRCISAPSRAVTLRRRVRFYSYPLPSGQPSGLVLALVFVGCALVGFLAESVLRRLLSPRPRPSL